MFGYVTIQSDTLTVTERKRYQAAYCGLCQTLGNRYGGAGRLTLTYDMTFLSLLLASLYDQPETTVRRRCPVNPLRLCSCVQSDITAYAADINLILAYYKCQDDWLDDHSLLALGESKLLEKKVAGAESVRPRQSDVIKCTLSRLSDMENANELNPDKPANCFGDLMGELFVWREDQWSDTLRRMGAALGRFIYLMDAVLDLHGDLKKERYNPLMAQLNTDFIPLLTMLMGECTGEFERLPLRRDQNILRNILYAGVWQKYPGKASTKLRKERG